jgi:Phage tail protein (Tail_P2_I)
VSSNLRTGKLIDNCTPSISYDSQVQAASESFDQQMYEIIDETGQVCFIPNIMGLKDENLVDILAWQFNVDGYSTSKDLEFRKSLVQQSIIWHKTKGTVALVQHVLDLYWPGGAVIEEWFDYMSPLPANYPQEPDWHDRYRFRITIDQTVILPADELEALKLIDRYKPVSRWCEGIIRPKLSEGNIGWAGMCLRFIMRESAAPDTERHAQTYLLSGPASGPAAVDSELFTVSLPTLTTVSNVVTVTPNDAGGGGTFTPTTLQLSNETPVAQFSYRPSSVGAKIISATNDGGLTNPAAVTYQVKVVATTYTLTGPASGVAGVVSSNFTVALPTNTITAVPVTVTPNDGGAGGTFTPTSVQLYATRRERAAASATFTYTPAP